MSTLNIIQVSFEIWGCIVSLIISLFTATEVTQGKPGNKLWKMLLINVLVLVSDSLAYVYRGDSSSVGLVMTRISNFALFLGEYVLVFLFAHYVQSIFDMYGQKNNKKWLYTVYGLMGITTGALVITQFTGFYYYFDSTNHYCRGNGIILSFLCTCLAILIVAAQFRKLWKKLKKDDVQTLGIVIVIPMVAIIIQFWGYGISLLNIALTISIIISYLKHYFNRINATAAGMVDEAKAETQQAMEKYHEMKKRVSDLEERMEKMKEN